MQFHHHDDEDKCTSPDLDKLWQKPHGGYPFFVWGWKGFTRFVGSCFISTKTEDLLFGTVTVHWGDTEMLKNLGSKLLTLPKAPHLTVHQPALWWEVLICWKLYVPAIWRLDGWISFNQACSSRVFLLLIVLPPSLTASQEGQEPSSSSFSSFSRSWSWFGAFFGCFNLITVPKKAESINNRSHGSTPARDGVAGCWLKMGCVNL